jgi:hypothetical protein
MKSQAEEIHRLGVLGVLLIALLIALAPALRAIAQTTGQFPDKLPNATIISDEADAEQGPESSVGQPGPSGTSATKQHSSARRRVNVAPQSFSAAVEPTHATLKVRRDSWAYAEPDTTSRMIERIPAGKLLNVTGSTRYYVQVKLKSGAIGYVPLAAVELTRPEDKIMRLTADAAVLSQPNRYGKKLSEVHHGHDVHVIGTSLNYIKIRMRSGLEGYIPVAVAQ